MPIEDPGEFTVTCDECNKSVTMPSTAYAGGTYGVDNSTLDGEDWSGEGDETFCPDCTATRNCETCEGHGWVEDEDDGGTKTCPDCGGEG